jgi:hypothetical protein
MRHEFQNRIIMEDVSAYRHEIYLLHYARQMIEIDCLSSFHWLDEPFHKSIPI